MRQALTEQAAVGGAALQVAPHLERGLTQRVLHQLTEGDAQLVHVAVHQRQGSGLGQGALSLGAPQPIPGFTRQLEQYSHKAAVLGLEGKELLEG